MVKSNSRLVQTHNLRHLNNLFYFYQPRSKHGDRDGHMVTRWRFSTPGYPRRVFPPGTGWVGRCLTSPVWTRQQDDLLMGLACEKWQTSVFGCETMFGEKVNTRLICVRRSVLLVFVYFFFFFALMVNCIILIMRMSWFYVTRRAGTRKRKGVEMLPNWELSFAVRYLV